MPRIPRVVAVGYPHHVTQRGNNRAPVFFGDEDKDRYLQILAHYSDVCSMEIWAYCLMENHVHLLVVPRSDESLARGIGGTSLVYTQYINDKCRRSGRVWQNRFYSCVVDKNRYLWAVLRYIESNPVRAGIVKNAEEYRWSSAAFHLLGRRDPVITHPDWIEQSQYTVYRELIYRANRDEGDLIRKATSTGRPLGGAVFVGRLESRLQRRLKPRARGRPPQDT